MVKKIVATLAIVSALGTTAVYAGSTSDCQNGRCPACCTNNCSDCSKCKPTQ